MYIISRFGSWEIFTLGLQFPGKSKCTDCLKANNAVSFAPRLKRKKKGVAQSVLAIVVLFLGKVASRFSAHLPPLTSAPEGQAGRRRFAGHEASV